MISATAILTLCPAKSMSNDDKKSLAIKTITGKQTISAIANDYQVSRKFVSEQKQKILTVVNEVFDKTTDDDKVLYQIPVTKNWLKQCVISLAMDCRSSFRGIMKSMSNLFDFNVPEFFVLRSVISIHEKVRRSAKHLVFFLAKEHSAMD